MSSRRAKRIMIGEKSATLRSSLLVQGVGRSKAQERPESGTDAVSPPVLSQLALCFSTLTDPEERTKMGFKPMRELLEQPTFIINGVSVKAPNLPAAQIAYEQRVVAEQEWAEEQDAQIYKECHETEADMIVNDEEGA